MAAPQIANLIDGNHSVGFDSSSFRNMQPEEKPFSPFERREFWPVSEEDLEYLRGEPAPLKIMYEVAIERLRKHWGIAKW